MEEAARARDAAREALRDITPPPLRELMDHRLQSAAVTPGVLTLLAARATGHDVDDRRLNRRAAGVQLIYEGLGLTRTLARSPPWEDDGPSADRLQADVDVLAAEVLVARGFALLARTEAAAKAVETVRALGRDETDRSADRPHPELDGRTLEADVFELAIIAGTSAVGVESPANARSFAVDLARSYRRDLPAAPELLSEPTVEALEELVSDRETTTAPDRVWAGSGASDP